MKAVTLSFLFYISLQIHMTNKTYMLKIDA